jgi:hypothetical protein
VKYSMTPSCFSTREEALAEIADRGWHALEYDAPAEEDELHWHDYDSVAFVLGGTCRTVFEDGSVMECGAGSRIEQPSHVVHRSGNSAYQAVYGLSVRLEDMSLPICKPVDQLERRLAPS